MNTLLSCRVAVAAVIAVATPTLGGLPALQPLGTALTGAPGCQHVIDLLMRYGSEEGLPPVASATVVPSPHGAFVLPASEWGDLCVTSLTESATSDPTCAPTFLIGVTNNSCRSVGDVQLSVVALLGPIDPCSPTANACLKEIPPGATVEVAVTLPVEALTMGSNGGVPVGFQKLLVAIDAFDRFVENDEANNLRLVCRSDIPRQTVAVIAPPAVMPVPDALSPAPQGPTSSLESALEEFGLDAQGDAVASRL